MYVLSNRWIYYWFSAGIIAVFAIPSFSAADNQDVPSDVGCTTVLPDEFRRPIVCIGTNLATLGGSPESVEKDDSGKSGKAFSNGEDEHEWQLIDIYYGNETIRVGESFAVYFDRDSESLLEEPMEDPLSSAVHQAINRAPEWLQGALYVNFEKIHENFRDDLAQAILSASDPYVDEVAFQIAHISYTKIPMIDPGLFEVNAEHLYANDDYLNYANIVDYGGPDYYSTVEYRVLDNGTPTWIEAPRDIYYWYIVHPKCSDESPMMGGSVYNEFWREFLFDYTHPDYLDRELYDLLSATQYVWDREEHDYEGGRPFTDDDTAVDVVGNWVAHHVPHRAASPRPIQPNQIITDHNGNCGELQDLLCAGARTALIPCISAMDICEDHVWCEFWDEEWHPYQVSWGAPIGDPPAPGPTHVDNYGICYDPDQGGGKEVSGIWDWRNDEYNYQVIDRYSEYCTLTVTVKDGQGNLVDGAYVRVATESLYGGLSWTAWDTTDSTGKAYFVLGDDDPGVGPAEGRDYYLRVDSGELDGYYPDGGSGTELVIDDAVAGGTYNLEIELLGGSTMPQIPVFEAGYPSDPVAEFKVEVDYAVPGEYKFGDNAYATYYNYFDEHGNLEFFINDEVNYESFVNGDAFEAFSIKEDSDEGVVSFVLPTNEKWHMVFSNVDQVNCYQPTDVTVRLYIDQNALDIELKDFFAYIVADGVEVYWDTVRSGKDLEGWNLYRRVVKPASASETTDTAQSRITVSSNRLGTGKAFPGTIASLSDWSKLNHELITGDPPHIFLDTGVAEDEDYEYKLEAVLKDTVNVFGPVTVDADGGALPIGFSLTQNYPNPFADTTTVQYGVPSGVYVRLKLYNVAGQLVKTFVDNYAEAGYHQVTWDGRDAAGTPLPSGVYFYRLEAGDFNAVKKLVICR
ncbi:MAG: T9SS type A sorting domain-containing protein [Candidatus Coatesbacteria bacterium]|nr:MAG: T9SS type A sorting domain-containing protein [Candidatus Coatesbacteria bacterium]